MRSSVARAGSVVASVFICWRMSRSWAGGRVLSVREIASVQWTPGGRSLPWGRGGRVVEGVLLVGEVEE